MEIYTSDSSDSDSREEKTLNYGRMSLTTDFIDDDILMRIGSKYRDIETVLLNHNRLKSMPLTINNFCNLKTLDISSNNLEYLPDAIFDLPLISLIAKNNQFTNKSLPKTLLKLNNKSLDGSKMYGAGTSTLKELNLSGNMLIHFPEQLLELKQLKYLYLGDNKIHAISKDIWKMQSLQILSMGGNSISEVPDGVGNLCQLQALILCDNAIENLPTTIAKLENLKSLLLHKNRLRHLPKDIIALKNLSELSLRDNPLVVRFVQDMALNPPSLTELAARAVKASDIKYGSNDIPKTLIDYLNCANCCVNPNCKGVFFDNRVEHIKFVDFCGKYRVPLLQYLCSSKCIETPSRTIPVLSTSSRSSVNRLSIGTEPGASGYMMRKVLLG